MRERKKEKKKRNQNKDLFFSRLSIFLFFLSGVLHFFFVF